MPKYKLNIINNKEYKDTYRLRYPYGILSIDYYNKTWAKEHIRRINAGEGSEDEYERLA